MATYALLVGIDEYLGNVRALHGCVEDVKAIRELLRQRVPDAQVRCLLDGEATREAFVQAVRAHLGSAGPGDTALLWFSGHGSQTRTTSAVEGEADGRDETLVFVDSRTPEGRDLLDKELGTLIAELAANGPEVVVALDACHSGNGTREDLDDDVSVRRIPADDRAVTMVGSAAQVGAGGWTLDGTHVLLAACRSDQTAKERPIGGVRRGVFSASVERALRAGAARTYRELLPLVRDAVVALGVADQTPQLELVGDAVAEAVVFTGAERVEGGFVVTFDSASGQWVMDAGAVHGIPLATDGSTRITIQPRDTPGGATFGDPADPADPATDTEAPVATPLLVAPDHTVLRILSGELEPGEAYSARLTAANTVRLGVDLPPDEPELLAQLDGNVLLVLDAHGPLRVQASPDAYELFDDARGRESVGRIPRGPLAALAVVTDLERIARWHAIERLSNAERPGEAASVSVDVVSAGPISREADDVVVPYVRSGGSLEPQTVELVVRNGSDRPMYCALVALGSSYAVSPLLRDGVAQIPPGGTTSRSIRVFIPDADARRTTRKTDVVKLISSTEQFELYPLLQPKLGDADDRGPVDERDPLSALDILLRSVRQRDLEPVDDKPTSDWSVSTLRIIAERPFADVPLDAGAGTLADGVTVSAPPGLGGTARLTSSTTAGRDLDVPLAPPLMLDEPWEWVAFSLPTTRDTDEPLDVLELSNVESSAVTPATPLLITVATPLAEDEHVIAVAFDGADYLPVGFADRRAGADRDVDTTVIRITTLPDAIEERGFLGAVKLLFRRLVRRVIGRDDSVTRLAIATLVDPVRDARIEYDDDRARIRDAVAAADRIVLIVHGIIGDTEGMSLGCFTMDDQTSLIGDYDLVLTFDYESINTPIDATAQELSTKLLDAGLPPGHGKTFDIVAHSMGGLVSRWMLEQLPQHPDVTRLVMAGTPNAGSPIPDTVDILTVWVAFALNALPEVAWPAKVVGWLLSAVEKVDVALDQLDPDSRFFADLRTGSDGGALYTLVLGDRTLKPFARTDVAPSLAAKVMRRAIDFGANGIFRGEVNDIAVSQASGSDLAIAQARALAPIVRTAVHCDHMTYFSLPEGRAALRLALSDPIPQ